MRTEPRGPDRNFASLSARRWAAILLGLILCAAVGLRLWHVDFGLPALNDPDEPMFVMIALDMLRDQRLNPGWFGHPATTLFYALITIIMAVGLSGQMTGRWMDADGFISALFADPGIIVLPARLFIVLCGVLCVYLTYRIGARAIGRRAGLIGAALLAANAVHIELSQVIRTDMMAGVLMLASTCFALKIAEDGRIRHHIIAGMFAGLACATKWPAMLVLANPFFATLLCAHRDRRALLLLPIAPIAALSALLLASPYLLLDAATVMRDLGGEARPEHLGATGQGLFRNLLWYLEKPLAGSFGLVGMGLALIGLLIAPFRAPRLTWAALPGAMIFLFAISGQALVWERWTVPILPVVALCIAIAIDQISVFPRGRLGHVAAAAMLAGLLIPMGSTLFERKAMRAEDTRQLATSWVKRNLPPGSSLLIESAAFDLFFRSGNILFPMGSAGCVDIRRFVAEKPTYTRAGGLREGRAIVDIGNVAPELLASCAADYAILTHYERYAADGERFAPQLQVYRSLLRDSKVRAIIRPQSGAIGGPVVHIVQLAARGAKIESAGDRAK